MLLQKLVESYEILLEDEQCDVPKYGYCLGSVSYVAVLSKEGQLKALVNQKIPNASGKKFIPTTMMIPQQIKRASNVAANALCDNATYVFGIDFKGKPKRAIQCFEDFKEKHLLLLYSIEEEEAQVLCRFLEDWDYDKAMEHPVVQPLLDELKTGANIVFRLENHPTLMHQNKSIQLAWEAQLHSQEAETMQCLVTGQERSVARLHPSIKGIRYGQSMGNTLVGFNANAYESYGNQKSQGLNAPVSEYATFAYSTALNYMLSDRRHQLVVGDTTTVFWAACKDRAVSDSMGLLFSPDMLDDEDEDENASNKRDTRAIKEMKAVFQKIKEGNPVGSVTHIFEETTSVYILGLAPNAARISIRYFIQESFGSFITKTMQHYADIHIEKQYENEPDIISVWRMLNETVPPTSKQSMASPLLVGAVMRSIMLGTAYPETLFKAIMLRVRAEKNITYVKAAVIKGYLIRKQNKIYKEVLIMALNESTTLKPYVLGRLFAELEKAQKDASDSKLNSTIKDRYFTSACATPVRVFPNLLKLSQHHIKKSDYGYKNEESIQKIMNKLDVEEEAFPKRLSMDEQGVFILGYYHQKNSFYKGNKED